MIDTNGTSDDSDGSGVTYHAHYDPMGGSNLCETLVLAIAEVAEVEPLDLDPLYETVDPELLDDVVGSDGASDLDGNVSFTYADHHVRVHASGLLEINPVSD